MFHVLTFYLLFYWSFYLTCMAWHFVWHWFQWVQRRAPAGNHWPFHGWPVTSNQGSVTHSLCNKARVIWYVATFGYSRPMELPWKGCCARRHIISRGVNQKVEWFPPVWWWCPLEITLVNYFPCISHRIHGASIYGNIYHQYTPFMLAYIPAPWIRHGYFFLFWNISNLLIFHATWWFQSNLQPEWWDLPCKFGARGCPFWQLSSTHTNEN